MTASPPFLIVFGVLLGGFGTLIGAGGGFLLLPALLFLYPSSSAAALASLSLAVVALNALVGSLAYARQERVAYRLGLVLAGACVPAASLGALLTARLPRGVFDALFGAVLLGLALFLFLRPSAPRWPPAGAPGRPGRVREPSAAGVVASAAVAFVSGLMGIGGSPLQVVVLTHLMRVPATVAMPTAQFMVLLIAAAGVVTHVVTGHFDADPARLLPLGLGVVLGAPLGATLSEHLREARLVRLLALALVSVSARLLLTALGW